MSLLQTSSNDEINHCEDPQKVSFGHLADPHLSTGYEPKDLTEEDNLHRNDAQVRPLFFHRPSMTSAYDSAESLTSTLRNRIWTMSKYGPCWLHCTCWSEKQVLTDHEFITP